MDTTEFFAKLQELAKADSALVATLRRSASYPPGLYPPAFPYIEPSLIELGEQRRATAYLVAGCWALAARREKGVPLRLPLAVKALMANHQQGGKSLEARFTTLLDADGDELPWRLRHLTSQLAAASIAVDWPSLLNDLWQWGSEKRWVQTSWARLFWSASASKSKASDVTSSS